MIANKEEISNITQAGTITRPAWRIPFRAQAGAVIQQGTGDGDALGTGNFSQYGDFNLSPI